MPIAQNAKRGEKTADGRNLDHDDTTLGSDSIDVLDERIIKKQRSV